MKICKWFLVFLAGWGLAGGSPANASSVEECEREEQALLIDALKVLSTKEAMALLDVADADGNDTPDGLFSYGDLEVLSRNRLVKPEIRAAAKLFRKPWAFYLLDVFSTYAKWNAQRDFVVGLGDLDKVLADVEHMDKRSLTYRLYICHRCRPVQRLPRL